ncbi:MAG: hypothetical protein ACLVHQ_07460 [Oscillospiraceae bacterium]
MQAIIDVTTAIANWFWGVPILILVGGGGCIFHKMRIRTDKKIQLYMFADFRQDVSESKEARFRFSRMLGSAFHRASTS